MFDSNNPSKLACCLGLDISITTLNRYINMSSLVESPKLEIEVYWPQAQINQ